MNIQIKRLIIKVKWLLGFLPKDEPCRKHFWTTESFRNCPKCGWSGDFIPQEDDEQD